jgi:NAD(P)-dependent dehydrogenase (short-subunit alcohol dehydrogenase family)
MLKSDSLARMKKRLQGKIALVTGASKGIGRATALALAAEGADVAVTARDERSLAPVVGQIEAAGARAFAVAADATNEGDVERSRAAVIGALGRVDILVNNVGIARYAAFSELTLADYDWMMNTNMRSSFLFTKAFLQPMIDRGAGWIVFLASVSGLFGFPGETAYCASKHAQVGFAKALDREVFDKGVRVSVIAPGGVNTEHAFGTGRTAGDPSLETFLEPEDVAQSVLFAVTQPPKSRTFLIGMRPSSEGYYA